MKTFGGLLIAFGLVLSLLVVSPHQANAAACANVSTYGAVRLNLPELPKKGEYWLWVRMQSPEQNGKVLVELNQTECLEVGSSSLQPNTWTWQAYSQDGQPAPIKLTYTEANSIKIIGIQAGIKVDRVLLTEPDCTPDIFGSNCAGAVEAEQLADSEVQSLPPPSEKPVSGKVTLSNTPFIKENELTKLTYSASGRILQSSETAEAFDTTRLENGKYTVLIESTLRSGEVIRESTVITIENDETPLSPFMRWLRQNQQSLKLIGLTIGGLAVATALLLIIRRWYVSRRERHFHGF